MKLLSTVIFVFLTGYCKVINGQISPNFDSLICQEWRLSMYEYADIEEEILRDPVQRDFKIIFYIDHRVKSNESGKIQNGIWQHIPNTRQLTICYNETNKFVDFYVMELSETQLIIEYKDSKGNPLKMWMVRNK